MFKKVTSRFFVYCSIASLSLFVLFHFLVWESFTKQLLVPNDYVHVGDLARIGYQYNSLELRKNEVTLSKQHIKSADWKGETVDIVTFGDSFSNGESGGLNPYYLDYIATEHNVRILNIKQDVKLEDKEYLNRLIGIVNGGFLDQLKPKIVLLESVERLALVRLAAEVDFNVSTTPLDVVHAIKSSVSHDTTTHAHIPMINSGNYKFLLYNIYYKFSHDAFGRSAVHRYNLNRNLFQSNTPNVLLFYNQDITNMEMVNKNNVRKMNDNLNHLSELLAAKGIKLIFMPAVDKYDLYSKYIMNNVHRENTFFDLLRMMPKKYYIVDTKNILAPLVENNITDVFYGDDTHWSYKASKVITRSIPIQDLLFGNSIKQ